MERRKVNYKVKYIGEEMDDLITGKIYDCIAEVYDEDNQLHDLAVIDESEEDYLYDPEDFEKVK